MSKRKKKRMPKPVHTTVIPDTCDVPIVCAECGEDGPQCPLCEEDIEEDEKMVCEAVKENASGSCYQHNHYHEKCWVYEKAKKIRLEIALVGNDLIVNTTRDSDNIRIEEVKAQDFLKFIINKIKMEGEQ